MIPAGSSVPGPTEDSCRKAAEPLKPGQEAQDNMWPARNLALVIRGQPRTLRTGPPPRALRWLLG